MRWISNVRHALAVGFFLFAGLVAGDEEAEQGNASTNATEPEVTAAEEQVPAPAEPAVPVFNAADAAGIRAAVGTVAKVQGRLLRVDRNEKLGLAFLDFQRERGGFTGIIQRQAWPAFEQAIGPDFRAALSGKSVELSGTISLHRGAPQIILTRPDQLRILSATEAPPARAGGSQPGVYSAEDSRLIASRAGETARVRGIVQSVTALPDGRMTFVNFGPERAHTFTAVIREERLAGVRKAHGNDLNAALAGKDVIISGPVSIHRNRPQINIIDPAQIQLFSEVDMAASDPVISVPDAASAVLSAADVDVLRAREGQAVRVAGAVHNVSAAPGGALTFIDFKSSRKDRFSAVIRREHLGAVEQALGQTVGAALAGRRVELSGDLTMHKGQPQIEISDATQIRILPDIEQDVEQPDIEDLQLPAGVYSSLQIDRLVELAGQNVSVQGLVDTVTTLPDERVTFINFKAAGGRQFTAIVRKPNLEAVRKVFGKYLDGTLGGEIVKVTGTISTQSGRPEIEVTDPAQIKIIKTD